MARTRPAYPPEFRQQMVELVRSGRTPEELSREFEPTGRILDRWEHVEDDERVLGVRCSGCKLITEYRIDRGDPPTGAQR